MKVLCLVDFPVVSDKWLWDYLPDHSDQVEFLCAPLNRRLMRRSKFLAYMLGFGWQAIQAALRVSRSNYDLVVAWEGKNGFLFATLKRFLGWQKPRLAILAFSVRGLPLRFLPWVRYAAKSIDHIAVPSARDVEYYSQLLHLPEERLTFCPLGVHDPLGSQITTTAKGDNNVYVFAGGYSHRDFASLVAASRDLDTKVLIVSPKANQPREELPPTVEWRDPVPSVTYHKMMMSAHFVVIPLKEVPFAVGQVDILNAMALGKAVVTSRVSSASDYITDSHNGILVEPGNPSALRQAIQYLLERPEDVVRLGANARISYEERYTFQAFARRVRDLLTSVAKQEKNPQ